MLKLGLSNDQLRVAVVEAYSTGQMEILIEQHKSKRQAVKIIVVNAAVKDTARKIVDWLENHISGEGWDGKMIAAVLVSELKAQGYWEVSNESNQVC